MHTNLVLNIIKQSQTS